MATATKKINTRDLSKQSGNPTHTIEVHYQELMAETDPSRLARDVIQLVREHGGISDKNLRRFTMTINQLKAKGIVDMQRYITNFMLAGCGLGTGCGRRWS